MRVAVFGAGAMGSFVGACLSRVADVTLIARPAHVRAVNESGLRLEGLTWGTAKLAATTKSARAAAAELVILTTKAQDTPAAAAALSKARVTAPVLSLQNGLTNIPTLLRAMPRATVLGGSTTHGVTFVRPGVVRHAGRGDLIIGTARGPGAAVRQVARLFNAAGLNCTVTSRLRALLWKKAVVNAAVNPITACLRIENGKVLDGVESRLLSRLAATEAAAVARAEGVAIPEPWQEVRRVLLATATNRSSMLQDIDAGRTTEVDAITGEIVRAARAHGIAVPVNAGLLRAVTAL